MNIRLFKHGDAKLVLSWIKSEREFRMWSADQYGEYPINPDDIVKNYCDKISKEEFYPLIFEENQNEIGHLILRYPTSDKSLIRLGFIIVDKDVRGKGFGKRIIMEAMKYANQNLGATKYNLGVFTNNESALKCYESLGFRPTKIKKGLYKFYDEEWDWQEILYFKP